MNGTAVCTPLAVERAALHGRISGLLLVRTGMGSRRSAKAAARLAAAGPRPVVVAGLAGALDPRLRPGDLVVATEVRGPDAATVSVPAAGPLAVALRRHGLRVHLGPVVSHPAPVHGAARSGLAAAGALAVDMESVWLAAAAAGGPFAVVRAVVDTPGTPLLRPGTVTRGLAALRSLRCAAPALREWLAATGPRAVEPASPRSFCAGVDRAIAAVDQALDRHGPPIYVRRQIVHNSHVVRRLQERGAIFVQELDEVPRGARVVLAAHGVAPPVREQAVERGLTTVDATCPLVAKVHAEVRRYAGRGDTVFLIGHADHEEVEGTLGEAPDDVVVVPDVAAAATATPRDPGRVAYTTQTTLAVDETDEIAQVLRARFRALTGPRSEDICYATTNRQQAVRALAGRVDLLLVVGSANSSNSRRLVEVAERAGTRAHLIDDARELDPVWLAGVRRVGVSAGASAPEHLVDELVACLAGFGPLTTTSAATVAEDVRFAPPKEMSPEEMS